MNPADIHFLRSEQGVTIVVTQSGEYWASYPLAEMEVSADGFRELARRSAAFAARSAAVLEGGYNLDTLPDLVQAALEGFDA